MHGASQKFFGPFLEDCTMAEITKLASTFKAWRFTIGVQPHHLKAALERCKELGLDPAGVRIPGTRGGLFSVVIPLGACANPQTDFMIQYMRPFCGMLVHGQMLHLICPLPSKPSRRCHDETPRVLGTQETKV